MISERPIDDSFTWVQVLEPTANDQDQLIKKYGIPAELLGYAVDPNERARVELDKPTNMSLVIFDVVITSAIDGSVNTGPVSFLMSDKYFVTFTRDETQFVNDIVTSQLPVNIDNQTATPVTQIDLVISATYQLAVQYYNVLNQVNLARAQIQRGFSDRAEHSSITQLMNLGTSLVYILTSLKSDVDLLNVFKRVFTPTMNDEQAESLDDVLVEAQQGLEMAQMASDIIERVSDGYSNLLDSNLNGTMKFLTVFSILLTIPAIVFGFFGQNVEVPFQNSAIGWILTIVVTLLLVGAMTWFFNKNHFFKD